MIKSTFFLLAFLGASFLFAQELNSDAANQIKQYEQALKKAIDDSKFDNAAGVAGKMAYIYWNSRMNDEAINYFQKSIEYNQQVGNKNGIKTAYINLGLVRIDNEEYEGALAAFKKGTELAKELKQKDFILSGLINAASVSQSLGKNQEAIDFASEALDYAQELENINLTKRCYGILYECYQALGNSEKSIEYFDLYSTVDRFLRDEQSEKIETESRQKVAAIASEKAKSDEALELSMLRLQVAQDSLARANERAERQRLQLKLNEISLREQETQLEKERLLRFGLIVILILTVSFVVILCVQYSQKKKKNILLAEQYRQINEQKEEIQEQGRILAIKNEDLAAVNKEKNLMMSMVAHDIKKPINDLTSLSQILEQYEDKLPDDFNHLVSVLKKSSGGYRDMVHKILDAGAIESRKLNVVEEKLSVQEVLENNVQSQSLTAADKNISFDLSDIPDDSFLSGDKIYLTQAIENVLYNAVKYSPEGSTIYLGAKKKSGFYELFIRDEGPGMDKEDLTYLFETFKPLKNGDMESTGLGLTISQKYINAMGGEIRCESELGNGTTFFMTLPIWDN
ncbi:MAG: tetratricopeptide repeat-containing sensor histidine kinase [Ekhidna sp.]|nr:tetratricopeptide repeat-containing sensor histidine kinase [Ekhidna sp.]